LDASLLSNTFVINRLQYSTMKLNCRLLAKSLSLALSLTALTTKAQAQCTVTLQASDTIICFGDSVVLNAIIPSDSLTTTFVAGNNHRGNMFDIVALNDITITGFSAHPMANTTIEIYYKAGTFVGFENNASAWTLAGSAAVIAQPQGTPTPVPVAVNVLIPQGQTYAFYVSSTNAAVSLNYTDGTTVGNVFSQDGNLQFIEGYGIEYPFSGAPFSPRIFNGNIHYAATDSASYLWSTGDTTSYIVVHPSNDTNYTVNVQVPSCPLYTDSVSVSITTPVVNLGNDFLMCLHHSNLLSAGTGFSDYLWSTGDTTSSISINGNTLGVGTHLFVLTASDSNGCSNSDSITVTVDNCVGIQNNSNKLSALIYPNPANQNVTIRFDLPEASEVQMTLINTLGQEVKIIANGTFGVGTQVFKTDLSDIQKGIYFTRIIINGQPAVYRLVKH
jgi:hypothetical protein